MEIQHFSHEHPLTLQMVNTRNFYETRCYACGKYISDIMYSCKTCKNYHLHKTCAELPEKIERHPFHPSHALPVVFNGPSYACCGCGKKHDKLVYYCKGCNFTLNPECALNPTAKYDFVGEGKIKHVLHYHPLTLGGNDLVSAGEGMTCLACEKRCSSNESYYSCYICRAFSLHTSCMESLPRVIWHSSHPEHPMMLRAKDQWFDRPCVTCGRTDNVLTYRCSMCRVEMDPGCALKQTKNGDRHDTMDPGCALKQTKNGDRHDTVKTQSPRSIPLNERVKQFFGGKK